MSDDDNVISLEERRQRRLERDGRETVLLHADAYNEIAEEVEEAILARKLPVFVRSNRLVRPIEKEVASTDETKTTAVQMLGIDTPMMRSVMDRACAFKKWDSRVKGGGGWVPSPPPETIAKLILSRAAGGPFPDVIGVINAPTIGRNGRILNQPGYDPDSRLLLWGLPAMPSIPTEPTREDAEDALNLLKDLLRNFAFVNGPSRSVGLSALLTPVCRGIIPLAPLHAASAPTISSGKSYLFHIASAIATGYHCPVIANSLRDEETEKQITAALCAGSALVSLDNLDRPLKSALLCQALEQPFLKIRPFGSNTDDITVESLMTWFATGINLLITADLIRRTILAMLDTNMERPELRQFAEDPVKMVLAERGLYIGACLTIVRAYIAAGLPGRLDRLASYDAWSDYIRSALVWLGEADPCETMQSIRENDPQRMQQDALFAAWPMLAGDGFRSQQLLDKALSGNFPELLEALQSVARDRKGNLDATVLGKWLGAHRDNIVTVEFDDGRKERRKLLSRPVQGGNQKWHMEVI